ncbi:hypothetical protein BLL42_02145 [Pseudomonas frederiksbergensis]|uniref:Uncharacterized protein n=1 Tax=Pseudomonas frederiksbergensis TaxID=104087 RepID=A0A1J0EF25_9PSED|nr:hypothetical protein BLL42_02145 [Pseudomonas frederiksbergensis]
MIQNTDHQRLIPIMIPTIYILLNSNFIYAKILRFEITLKIQRNNIIRPYSNGIWRIFNLPAQSPCRCFFY